jgi:hypothetical protein
MRDACTHLIASVVIVTTIAAVRVAAQASDASLEIVVASGRPLRVALDERVMVKRVGQRVTGVLVEAIYVYDRVVLPAGARVVGHIAALENASKVTRARAMLGESFVPLRRVTVSFDTVVMDDGRQVPIHTVVTGAPSRMQRQVAGGNNTEEKETDGVIARARNEVERARDEIVRRKNDAIAAVREPGRLERLKEMAIDRLPYHPQFLGKGIVYNADLVSPVSIGTARPIPPAVAGVLPAPNSILKVRLGVVTEPVFSCVRPAAARPMRIASSAVGPTLIDDRMCALSGRPSRSSKFASWREW